MKPDRNTGALQEALNTPLRDDPRIKAIHCWAGCFGGYCGMDTCGKCDGIGSHLAIVGVPNKRWPNTENGYKQALEFLDQTMAMG